MATVRHPRAEELIGRGVRLGPAETDDFIEPSGEGTVRFRSSHND